MQDQEIYQVTKEQLFELFKSAGGEYSIDGEHIEEAYQEKHFNGLLVELEIKPFANPEPVDNNSPYKSLYKDAIADLNKAMAENLSLSMQIEHLKSTVANTNPVAINVDKLQEIAKIENVTVRMLVDLLKHKSGQVYLLERYPLDKSEQYDWIKKIKVPVMVQPISEPTEPPKLDLKKEILQYILQAHLNTPIGKIEKDCIEKWPEEAQYIHRVLFT